MSTGYSLRFHVLWITLQILMFGYRDPRPVMANSQFTPYVSEFEYASRFHPSKNPDCPIGSSGNPNERKDGIKRRNFESTRYRRSPEEGSPVGQEPSIEVRAILVRCPKNEEETDDVLINRNIYNITAGRSQDILDFHGFDRDEQTRRSEVRDCRRKIIITMKFNNIGRTKTQEEFVVIDHVLDPVTMHKSRLLNPFVIKVRQEPVLQLYGLKFQGVVNAEAREEVMSNKQSNYTGCDDTSGNPTCGQMFFENKPIPYSQGFCCSCDPEVNVQRQASILNDTVHSSLPNFFSKPKDRSIRPFKITRSVKTNFLNVLSEPDDIHKLSSPYLSVGSIVENPKNENFRQNFRPMEDNSTLVENSYENERDLLNLKNFKKSPFPKFNEFENKNRMNFDDSSRLISTSFTTNSSGPINEKATNHVDTGRDGRTRDNEILAGIGRKDEEKFSKRKSTINIIDELTKLEEDYKNFRISSIMRDEERDDRTNDNTRFNAERTNPTNVKYSDKILNVMEVANFHPIDTLEKEFHSKNNDDNVKLILPLSTTEKVPLNEMIYDASSTLSVDVKLIFRARGKSTLNRVNSSVPLSNICSSENFQAVTTTTRKCSRIPTVAVLWQKLVSDRVYPSSERKNIYSKGNTKMDEESFQTTEITTTSNETYNNEIADLLSNVVMSDNEKLLPDSVKSNVDPTTVDKKDTETTSTIEWTTVTDKRDDFTTNLDGISNDGENFTDFSPSISRGKATKNDAIVLSGSLRNQLGNWLTYDVSKKFETKDVRKNTRGNYNDKTEVGNKGNVEHKRVKSLANVVAKRHDKHRLNRIIFDRKPVEIHLETNYDHESSSGIDDKSNLPKIRSKNDKFSHRVWLDNTSPERVVSRKRSKRRNSLRSYRSIAEDDRFFANENDRQRNIDKRIEDEFEEISNVLKDAGEGPKIIRERPKSDETFEKDDSVMEKFASIFHKIPKDIANENHSHGHESPLESQTSMSQNIRANSKMSRYEKDRLIAERLKLKKDNDVSKIAHNSQRNLVPRENNARVEKFNKIIDNIPIDRSIEENSLRGTGRTTILTIAKQTKEFVEPVSEIPQTTGPQIIVDRFKIPNLYTNIPEILEKTNDFTKEPQKIRDVMKKDSTTSYSVATAIVKNESPNEPISEMPLTTGYQIIVDRFKIVNEFRELPDIVEQSSKHNLSNFPKLLNKPEKTEKDVFTNTSFPNVPSPELTIENLKKQLRNEAEHYSSQSRSAAAPRSNFKNFENNWKYSDDVREVNTELTPAEKVEDSITEEETLPPDEETTYTSPLSETTIFRSFETTSSVVDIIVSNGTGFPRFSIRSFERNYPKKKHAFAPERTDKVFLLLKESSPSSYAPLRHFKRKRDREKRIHRRRRHRRNKRNEKHLTKKKRNVKRTFGTTTIDRSFAKGKPENEDDDNPWYDTTIEKGLTVSRDRITDATTKLLSSTISTSSHVRKNRKRRYHHEMPLVSDTAVKNEFLRPSNGGLRIEEIPKSIVKSGKKLNNHVEPYFHLKMTKLHLPRDSNEKKSVLQDFMSISDESDDKKVSESIKPKVTIGRTATNLQSLSSRKFPSFYPKSSDIIAMSEKEHLAEDTADRSDKNSKRDDTMNINDNERNGLILYDYEDGERKSNADDVNAKRSLDKIISNEIIDGLQPSEGWKEKMELLKLKKHADVLKEYLNWRQDVAPPVTQIIPDYTTKISMTKERPEETTTIGTTISNESDTPTLTNTESTYSTITKLFTTTIESETDAITLTNSRQHHRNTEDTTIVSAVESSTVTTVTVGSKNSDQFNNADNSDVPTGCFHDSNKNSTTDETVHHDEEVSTGRILPPCRSKIEFTNNLHDQSFNRSKVNTFLVSEGGTLPKVITDNRGQLSDVKNDLVVISVLEKSLRRDKNNRGKSGNDAAKIYKIREEIKSSPNSRRRRRRFKKKNSNRKFVRRDKRVPGRRLMAVRSLDENDNYEEQLSLKEFEENNNVDPFNDENMNKFDVDKDNEMLKRKWSDVIEKIIRDNSSTLWNFRNTTKSPLIAIPSDERSALKQLHFYDADKYIRKIAKKIIRNSNIHDSKNENDMAVDRIKGSRRGVTSGRRHHGNRRIFAERKLKQYPDNSMTRLRIKMSDSYKNNQDSSDPQSNLVHKNLVSNVTNFEPGRDGRDFAISLTGKIHVEGGTNGKPISISFDTSPDIPKTNEPFQLTSNESTKLANDTKNDAEHPPITNILSSLFNIAPAAKVLENNTQKDEKHLNSNVSHNESVRAVNDDPLRAPREYRRKKFSDFTKNVQKIRRSRAIDPQNVQRYSKYRGDRSYDSEDSELVNDSEDYPESSLEYDSDIDDNDDSPTLALDRRNFESESRYSNLDEPRSFDSPEVKVIKIIPLNVEKSSASLTSLDSSPENHHDTKSSRMTASQLPKMPDNDVPRRTIRPGKIKPAELPWRENDKLSPDNFDFTGENFPSKSLCCSDENKPKALDGVSLDRRISTDSPMNLRVIGLMSMGQSTMNEPTNLNANSDSNHEIVPLIHVKIQQQSFDKVSPDRNCITPLRPNNHRKGCTKIEMTHSKNILGDDSLCSQINNDLSKVNDEDTTKNSVIPTLDMNNDEELREPIASCPEIDKSAIPDSSSFSDDKKCDSIQPMEKIQSCQGDQEMLSPTSSEDTVSRLEARKKIRMKNMLAILEFMKKINKIMNGDERTDIPNDDYNDAVIKLEKVIILPNNQSDGIDGRHEEPETTTHRVVVIGEGVRHDSPCGGTSLEENSRPSENQDIHDTISYSNDINKLNEIGSLNKSFKTNQKFSDQDQSFLFYGKNDKLASSGSRSDDDAASDRLFARPNNNENATNFRTKEDNDTSSDSSLSNLPNSLATTSPGSSRDNEATETVDPRETNRSNKRVALRNFERKIDDRLHDLRKENSNDYEESNVRRTNKRMRRVTANKRKSLNTDFSSFPKVKRHRSINRLPSYRNKYDFRDARSQIYRSRPFNGLARRRGDREFGRFAADEDIPEEKRKKEKKKRRRKKKRKKKKKKKGKSGNDAANRGKGWWPFGRQLMSLNEKRHVILDSNFDRRQVDRAKTNRQARRRIPFSLMQRTRRRIHRSNYPHARKRKTKKQRKHKKERRKKKKKKKKMKMKKKGDEDRTSGRNKRQIKPGGTQARGGQNCMDRQHPSNVNSAKYLESAHCLRFSDLWYSVYELESPIMEHTVYLQLFEKQSFADGTTHWDDLTQGTMVRMGTFTRHQRDDKPTIVFTYSGAKMESQNRALNLDPGRQRLLVPSPVPSNKASEYPTSGRGAGEYLVVQTSAISNNGKECDKAGVSFAAFAKQNDRCGRAKDTCLKNQPLAYWRHDMEARDSGRPGCYFLSNFATVPTNPIKYNVTGTGSREYLGLEYQSAHVSAIDIEVRTDYNAIVRVGSSGRVTEVYVDSTSFEHTVVTVVISNMGLASSPYQPRITDCPTGLPVSWTKAKGIMQVIPPQHDQRVTLDLYGQLLLNDFHCSVEVVNHRGELVAMRRIRVQKMDRCFCVWHCLCACIGSVSGMGCQPMSPEHYHAAGFQGPVPVVTTETSILMNTVKDVVMLSALLVLLLLLMGLLKWFIGMFAPAVGRWGLGTLLEGSRIEKYLEPELRCRCVVTDEDGVPVHPDTGQRTIRLCSRKLEFVLNLIFFLTYPIAICCNYFRRSLQTSRQHRCCPDESKMCLINEKSSCPKMICVSTYGDSRNSKLEAEDTRYVMNELKKSQESLQDPKGTKKKDARNDRTLSRKSSHRNKSTTDVNAKRLVDDLLKKRTVFRNLIEPIGGLAVPSGTTYSLRGYFLNAENGGYRFITPCPFKQYWLIENNQKKSSKSPEIYPSKLFMCSFGTARDVYESNEISLSPKGICINVQYLNEK